MKYYTWEKSHLFRTVLVLCFSILIVSCGEEEPPDGSDESAFVLENGWVQYETSSGMTVDAYYNHPVSETTVPAVIYNHGKYVEENGYDGAVAYGYDITDFSDALANSGYAGIAPLRLRPPRPTADDGRFDATIQTLQDQTDIDDGNIFMYGFSRGGLLTLQYTVNDDSDLKGVILVSPSPGSDTDGGSNEFADELENLNDLSVPFLVLLGESEPNPTITHNCTTFVNQMESLGKDISFYTFTGTTEDPADHSWFYLVRSDYWTKIDSFVLANSNQ